MARYGENHVTMRVHKNTQRKLKLISALIDESMITILERLVSTELKRVNQELETKGYASIPGRAK